MIIPLKKPLKHDNIELKEIVLDFDNAPGSLLMQADIEYKKRRRAAGNPVEREQMAYKAADEMYCLILAAKMLDVPTAALEELPMRTLQILLHEVMAFLGNPHETMGMAAYVPQTSTSLQQSDELQ